MAIFKPADVPSDPILALIQSLADPRALPELFPDGTKPKEIADLIRVQPQGGGLLLRQALTQASSHALTQQKHNLEEKYKILVSENREEDARVLRNRIDTLTPPAVRIALLADQLEELFTSDLSPDTLETFIGILISLANSGRIFLLATLRSDFYPRCLEHPNLVALMQGDGTFALPAASPADIGQMIRQPAAIAGLAFEENASSGENLDELLRDEAIKDPAALPLLSYTLEQLYDQRSPDGTLTLAAYHALGGLNGAIGSRAETVFTQLPSNAQAAFDTICKQLVALQEGGQPTRRRAEYSTLTRSPEAKTLVDALVNARLLTADQCATGERTISVAHEALLRHWPRLVSWVEENRIFLNTRSRVASRLTDWLEKNKSDDYLIPRGPNLSAAESILSGHLSSLEPIEIEFIGKSIDRVRKDDQRKLRNARLVTAGALVLSLIAVAGGIFAIAAKRQAQVERNSAITQEKIAEAAKEQAQLERNTAIAQEKIAKTAQIEAVKSETRTSYVLGIERIEAGKNREGMTTLAKALTIQPDHLGALTRLYSEQLYSLPQPIPLHSFRVEKPVLRQRISGAQFGPDQIVSLITSENKPLYFDLNTMAPYKGPWNNEPDSFAPLTSYDSKHALNIRADLSMRIWNTKNTKQSTVIQTSPGFAQIAISLDGKLLAEAVNNGTVNIYDTANGEIIKTWEQSGYFYDLNDSRSEFFISVADKEIVIYDCTKKDVSHRILPPENLNFIAARPAIPSDLDDENHIAVVQFRDSSSYPYIDSLRFLDLKTGEYLDGSRTIEARNFIWDFAVSPSAEFVAIATQGENSRIVHISDASKDKPYETDGYTTKIAFSPDQRLLISARPDGTVFAHEITSGNLVFNPIRHQSNIEDLSVSWDGRYLLTSTSRVATIWDLAVGPALSLPIRNNELIINAHLDESNYTIKSKDNIHTIDITSLSANVTPIPRPENANDWIVNETIDTCAVYFNEDLIEFYKVVDNKLRKISSWKSPNGKVEHWRLSPDGKVFVTTTKGKIFSVNTQDGSLIAQGDCPPAIPYTVEISKDKSTVFTFFYNTESGVNPMKLLAFDLNTCEPIPLSQPLLYERGIVFSPDGKWMAASGNSSSSGSDYCAYLWNMKDLEAEPIRIPHPDFIASITFSPDYKKIALAGASGGARVWSLSSNPQPLANAITDPFGGIETICFSPDSYFIATIASNAVSSRVRVWDWKEALPVSYSFDFPTVANRLIFSKEGNQLFIITPDPFDITKTRIHTKEISPPKEIIPQILPLTEAITALKVRDMDILMPVDSFDAWQEIRTKFPNTWFLASPSERSISPTLNVTSMRWMESPIVPLDDLRTAMPSVAIANAALAHWEQVSHNSTVANANSEELTEQELQDQEYSFAQTQQHIDAIVAFAERNSRTEAGVCYHLAMHAISLDDSDRCQEFVDKALKIDPTHPPSLALASERAYLNRDYNLSKKLAQSLLKIDPDKPSYQMRMALALWCLDDKINALRYLDKAPDDPSIGIIDRADMLVMLDRTEDALKLYQEIAELQKKDAEPPAYNINSLICLVTGHYHNNDKEKAIEFYRELITIAPGAIDRSVVESAYISPIITDALLSTYDLTHAKDPALFIPPTTEN
jgi:WD40 repeat protein/tetratricopeptide (TPR) repeat protein